VLEVGAIVSVLFLLVALVGLSVDHRTITGVAGWIKPTKFAISITVYLVTIRWIIRHVRGHQRAMTALSLVVVLTLTAEVALISLQVVRGTTSHYNEATPFDTAVFLTMGGLIAALFLATIAVAVIAMRSNDLGLSMSAALRWGLGVALLGMAQAVLMIENQQWNPTGGHTVGARDGGPGLPLLGWSTHHGDLRIAHFVGLHALQATLVLAWLLRSRSPLSDVAQGRLVAVIGGFQACLVGLLSWQALRGQPLLRPDLVTVVAGLGLVAAALLLTGLVCALDRSGRPSPVPLGFPGPAAEPVAQQQVERGRSS
jgi:hypothetical protein